MNWLNNRPLLEPIGNVLPIEANGSLLCRPSGRKLRRVDNGPEFISDCLHQWAETRGIAIQHIQPGKPQQNACVERYNRTVRHEWLDQYMFATIKEVQDYATDRLWTYNNDRPDMRLGGITPAQKLKQQMAA